MFRPLPTSLRVHAGVRAGGCMCMQAGGQVSACAGDHVHDHACLHGRMFARAEPGSVSLSLLLSPMIDESGMPATASQLKAGSSLIGYVT